MTVLRAFALAAAATTTLTAQSTAPAPRIEHGRVTVRTGTIAEAVSSAAPGDEPAWVAWRVPMIDGQGTLCSTWTSDGETVRGEVLDARVSGDGRPQVSPPTAPISLEAGTQLVVLTRVVGHNVERLRSLSDDCPIDANDRTVTWLPGAGAADSLRFLTAS